MRGFYTIYTDDGPITVENLITDRGKALILAYLAGDLAYWGDEIAVGISSAAAAATDTALGYEVGRGKVLVTEALVSTNSILLKATLPQDVIADIYELGVFSTAEKVTVLPATPLSDFDPTYLETVNLTATDVNSRIGERAALLAVAAGATGAGSVVNLRLSLEARQLADVFTLAYHSDGNATAVEVRLYTSPTTYFTYSFTPATGYNLQRWDKQAFTTSTGASWLDTVTEIEFVVTAGALAANVSFDGLRIETPNTSNDYGLVSRSVLATPIAKGFDKELEIEYTIQFGW